MRFAVFSDPHFGNADRLALSPVKEFVSAVTGDPTVEFAVVTGDLTDCGYDGSSACWFPSLCMTAGSREDQLGAFLSAVAYPIQLAGKHVYLIPGNHDQYNGSSIHPVNEFIRRAHGNTHYKVVRGGVLMLFCDVYPDAGVCAWMENTLIGNVLPILVFFHYNLQGVYSDWWSDVEKEAFRNVVSGQRVLGIFVGHLHNSYVEKWHDYSVYGTAGDTFAVCDVDISPKGVALTVTFTR